MLINEILEHTTTILNANNVTYELEAFSNTIEVAFLDNQTMERITYRIYDTDYYKEGYTFDTHQGFIRSLYEAIAEIHGVVYVAPNNEVVDNHPVSYLLYSKKELLETPNLW